MLSRIIGKSKDKEEDTVSQSTRRKDGERKSTRRRSVAKVSSDSRKRGDDHDREFNPTSTSHSSITRAPFSGTGAGSVASSYATAPSGRKIDEEYVPPGVVRNGDQTSNVRSERRDRDEDENRRQKSGRRSEKDRGWEKNRDREPSARVMSREDNRRKERGLTMSDTDAAGGNVRAPIQPSSSFSEQIGSADFVQFPGQYDGPSGFIGQPAVSTTRISDHVQDQFPGQFPIQSAAPYRPPLGASQGRPGLAADYYGDFGQSVAEQPGVRPHPPAIIVGAQPHLQTASSIAAPPPEPSASGGVGAAASFFTGGFGPEDQGHGSYNQASTASANAPVYQQAPCKPSSATQYFSSNRPNNNHSTSAPAVSTLGAAAAGAAAGYLIGSQSSHQPRPEYTSSVHGHGRVSPAVNHRPQSQSQNYDSMPYLVQHTKPSKHSSQSTNVPLNVAGNAGAAGLAAAAYQHNNHSVNNSSMGEQYSSTTLTQRHRHHGPFSKLVDFFKDPDGVAQFEEYTEYIGVCKYCFTPGSSPRDAPRKHLYRRRRSNERHGGSARVDKDRRYWSSEGETHHRNKKPWFATGIAGYGLAKVAESLFSQDYSRSGRNHDSRGSPSRYNNTYSPDRKSYSSHGVTKRSAEAGASRRSRSKDRIETGITSDGKFYKRDSHGGKSSEPSMAFYDSRRRSKSRSRSRSKDRKRRVVESTVGTAAGSSAVFSSSRRQSPSPKKVFVRSRRGSEEHISDPSSILGMSRPGHRHGDHRSRYSSSSRKDVSKSSHGKSSERRHKSHKRDKESKGFFSFSNGSSSSSNEDLAFGVDSDRRRSGSKSKARESDHYTTDTALIGLGVAATAFAHNETREKNKSKKVGELVAVKESKHNHSHGAQWAHQSKKKLSSSSSDEDLWESASDDDEYASADSNLAYGHSSRRASLSSDSSGMSKWGWRWGGKRKERKERQVTNQPGPVRDSGVPIQRGASISGLAAGASFVSDNRQHFNGNSTSSSVPLELVDRVSASDHSRFDAIGQGSAVSSNQPTIVPRPIPVPIHHPQPKVSVPPAVYASQPPFSHSYSAPIGGLVTGSVFPQERYQPQPPNSSTRNQGYVTDPEDKMPGSFPRGDQLPSAPNPTAKNPEPRRRDTSPSMYASELASDSIPSQRRNPYQDDASTVRFDLTEEQDKKNRLNGRRQKEEDEDRREKLRQAKASEDRHETRQREQEIADQRVTLRQQREDQDRREKARQEQEDQDRRETRRREREMEDQRERLRQKKEDEDRRERVRQTQDDEVRREKRLQEKEAEARQERLRQKQESKDHRQRLLEEREEEQRSATRERKESEGKSNKPSLSKSDGNGRFERTEEEIMPQIIEIEPRSGNSWAAPVAVGIIGAAIGAAETSKVDAQRKNLDEQKRREREYRSISDEDEERQGTKEEPLRRLEHIERKDWSLDEKPISVWQAAAKVKRSSSHEDYAAYFAPPELLSRSHHPMHEKSANADNSITFSEDPDIITIEPTGFHDSLSSPAYSFTPTGDEADPHPMNLPWVPKLKLIAPTPTPSRAGSINDRMSPISQPSRGKEVAVEEPSKSPTDPKVTWGEPETIEYIPITPMDHRDHFIESPSSEHGNEKQTWQVSSIEDAEKHKSSPPSGPMQSKNDGTYGDDLEFAAVLAAGLEDTGFDPSVVIDDPSFRRRNSPPGSEQLGTYSPPSKFGTGKSYSPTREFVSLPKSGFIEGEIPSVHVPGAFDEDEAEETVRKIDKNHGNEAAKRQSIDNVSPAKQNDGKIDETKTISNGPEISTSKPIEFVRSVDTELKPFAQDKANISPKTDDGSEPKGFEQVKAEISPKTDTSPELKGFEQIKSRKSPKMDVDPRLKGFEQVESKYSPKTVVDPDLKGFGFEQIKADNSMKTDVGPDSNRLEQVKAKDSSKTDIDSGDDELVLLSRNNTPEDDFFDASRSLGKNEDSKVSSRELGRTPAESQLDHGTKDYDGKIQSTVSDPLHRKHRRDKGPKPRRSSENADLYESPSEDALSIAASAPVSNDAEEGGKNRKKSKRRSSDLADSASLVSSRKYADGADSHSKAKKEKKGLFGFLSRSTESQSESPRTKEKSTETPVDDVEESKRSKDSKDRRSSQHGSRHRSRHEEDTLNSKADSPFPPEGLEDDYESRLHKSKGRKDKRRSTGGNTTNDSGRISQDLPAKDQETSLVDEAETGDSLSTNANKQNLPEEPKPISFLGMRQEIPPLPDSPDAFDFSNLQEDRPLADIPSSLQDLVQQDNVPPKIGVNDDLLPISGHSRPTSPLIKPENQGQLLPDLQGRDENLSHAVTSSPTAIPVNFRRPPPSPAFIRSYSSTPLSSNANTPVVPFRQKPRPRSTEFKSSNEFRPLWLVERHSSRQEPSLGEIYPSLPPSLPSSHSNSRSSSVQDPEEHDLKRGPSQIDALDLVDTKYKPRSEARGLLIDTDRDTSQPDLLDSQQPTPTAPSFDSMVKEEPAPAKIIKESESTPTAAPFAYVLPSANSPSIQNPETGVAISLEDKINPESKFIESSPSLISDLHSTDNSTSRQPQIAKDLALEKETYHKSKSPGLAASFVDIPASTENPPPAQLEKDLALEDGLHRELGSIDPVFSCVESQNATDTPLLQQSQLLEDLALADETPQKSRRNESAASSVNSPVSTKAPSPSKRLLHDVNDLFSDRSLATRFKYDPEFLQDLPSLPSSLASSPDPYREPDGLQDLSKLSTVVEEDNVPSQEDAGKNDLIADPNAGGLQATVQPYVPLDQPDSSIVSETRHKSVRNEPLELGTAFSASDRKVSQKSDFLDVVEAEESVLSHKEFKEAPAEQNSIEPIVKLSPAMQSPQPSPETFALPTDRDSDLPEVQPKSFFQQTDPNSKPQKMLEDEHYEEPSSSVAKSPKAALEPRVIPEAIALPADDDDDAEWTGFTKKKGKKGNKTKKSSASVDPSPNIPEEPRPVLPLSTDSLAQSVENPSSQDLISNFDLEASRKQPTANIDDDDEWTSFGKKKGKKGNKTKRDSASVDPSPNIPEEPRLVLPLSTDSLPQLVENPSSRGLTSNFDLEASRKQPAANIDDDDEWTSFGKKKGKKGNKTKRGSANVDPSPNIPGELRPVLPLSTDSLTPSVENPSSRDLTSNFDLEASRKQPTAENDDDDERTGFTKKKGKKGNKTKRGSASVDPSPNIPEESRPVLPLSTDSLPQSVEHPPSHDLASNFDLEASQKQPTADIDDDEWTSFGKKKGKKGKKNKRDNAIVDPSPKLPEGLRPVLPSSTDSPAQSIEIPPSHDLTSNFDLEASQKQPTADIDDDEWTGFGKKMGKKGKKNKRENTIVDPTPKLPEEPRPVLPLSMDSPTQSVENRPNHDLTSNFDLEAPREQPTADNDDDDEWTGLTKKKGKKGKKGKGDRVDIAVSSSLPEEREPSAPLLSTGSLNQPKGNLSDPGLAQEPDLDAHQKELTADTESAGSDKKKGKKGQRSKTHHINVAAFSNLPEEREPFALLSSTDSLNQPIGDLSDPGLAQEPDLDAHQKGLIADTESAGSDKEKWKKLRLGFKDFEAAEADPNQVDFAPSISGDVHPEPEINDERAGIDTEKGGVWKKQRSSLGDDNPAEAPTQAKSLSNMSDDIHPERDFGDGLIGTSNHKGENGESQVDFVPSISGDVHPEPQIHDEWAGANITKGEGWDKERWSLRDNNPAEAPTQAKSLSTISDEIHPERDFEDEMTGTSKHKGENGESQVDHVPSISGGVHLEPQINDEWAGFNTKKGEGREKQQSSLGDENPAEAPMQAKSLSIILDEIHSERDLEDELMGASKHKGENGDNQIDSVPSISGDLHPEPQMDDEWAGSNTQKGEEREKQQSSLGDDNLVGVPTQAKSLSIISDEIHSERDLEDGLMGTSKDKEESEDNQIDFVPTVSGDLHPAPEIHGEWAGFNTKKGEGREKQQSSLGDDNPVEVPTEAKFLSITSNETHPERDLEDRLMETSKDKGENEDNQIDFVPSISGDLHPEPEIYGELASFNTKKGEGWEKQKSSLEDDNNPAEVPMQTKSLSVILDETHPERDLVDRLTEVSTDKGENGGNTVDFVSSISGGVHSEPEIDDEWIGVNTKKEGSGDKQLLNHGDDNPAEVPTQAKSLSIVSDETHPERDMGDGMTETSNDKGGNGENKVDLVPSISGGVHPEPEIDDEWLGVNTKKGGGGDKQLLSHGDDNPAEVPTQATSLSIISDETHPGRDLGDGLTETSNDKGSNGENQDPEPRDLNTKVPAEEQSQPESIFKKGEKQEVSLEDITEAEGEAQNLPALFSPEHLISGQFLPLSALSEKYLSDQSTALEMSRDRSTPSKDPMLSDLGFTLPKDRKNEQSKEHETETPASKTDETNGQDSADLSVAKALPLNLDNAQPTSSVEPSVRDWDFTQNKNGEDRELKKQEMCSAFQGTEETREQISTEWPTGKTMHLDSTVAQPTPSDEPSIPDWEVTSTKKGKKDKMSKKRAIDSPSLGTEETLEPGSAEFSIDEPVPLGLKITQPTTSTESSIPDWGFTSTKIDKRDSPFLETEATPEQGSAEFLIDETVPLDLNVTQPTTSTEPSIPDRGFTLTKKDKKNRKSKKRAIDSPSLGTEATPNSAEFSIDETIPLDLSVTQPTTSTEPSIPDWESPLTKKGKKDKKSKKRAMDSPSLETEATPEGSAAFSIDETLPLEPNVTQPTTSTEPSIPDREFMLTKKDKKDRKSKKRAMDSPTLETEATPEQGSAEFLIDETMPFDLNVTQPTTSTEPSIPDWNFTLTKKDKRDRKSKKRAMDSPNLETGAPTGKGPAEILIDETIPLDPSVTQPTTSIEPSIPDWESALTKKGKKDKKSKMRAMDGPFVETGAIPEQGSAEYSIDETVPLDLNVTQQTPSIEPGIPDWKFPSTKKNKKSKRSGNPDLEIDVGATASVTDIVPGQLAPPKASVESNQSETSKSAHPSPRPKTEPLHSPTGAINAATSTKSETKSVEEPAVVTNLETGVIGTEVLQRSFSKKDKQRKANKADKSDEWADLEAEEGSESLNPSQHEIPVQEQAQPPVPKQQPSTDAQQQFQDTPPQSPRLPTNQDIVTDDIRVQTSPIQWEKSVIRDSAVHISDSPLVPENLLVNRAVRDSGYQDTEASPLVQSGSMFARNNTAQQNAEDAMINPLVREIGSNKTPDEPNNQRLKDSQITSQNLLNISVEVDPAYDVSISKPHSKRGRSRTTSRATRDNDEQVHSDSNQDLRNLQTTGSTFDDPREPSPVSSTTKERSSVLFQSSPSTREDFISQPLEKDSLAHDRSDEKDLAEQKTRELPDWTQLIEVPHNQVLVPATERALSPPAFIEGSDTNQSSRPSLFGGPPSVSDDQRTPSRSPFVSDNSNRPRLNTITEYSPEESPLHKKNRSISDVGSPERGVKSRRRSATPQRTFQHRMGSPLGSQASVRNPDFIDDLTTRFSWPPVDEDNHTVDLERSRSRNTDEHRISRAGNTSALASGPPKQRDSERRSLSGASVGSVESISAIIRTPDQIRSASGLSQRGSGTPPLRRVDRSVSSDLRLAHKKSEAKNLAKPIEAEPDLPIPSSSTYDPTKDKGKGRVRDMADIYEGWGDVHAASPLSPTRPPSMRRRQSLQILDLETKLDQLVSENRLLQESKSRAEKTLEVVEQDRSQQHDTFTEAVQTRDLYLRQKDADLNELKRVIEGLQGQVSQLTEIKEDLTATRGGLEEEHKQRYNQLEADHSRTHQQWQQSTLELDELRHQHTQLSAGMEEIVRHEINVAVEEKNLELRKLRDELEDTKEQVRVLQQQILASKSSENFLVERDEDYFDTQCQELCGHVQQWVLRFSKFSDSKACYLASEIKDEKITDRFENAILDGSDVDYYLRDRVKRRDVFMSVVMSLVWEYIFTRYLFGMDREQRQKLKALEKTLAEVGPATAVIKWRANTLTLLSRRESFQAQRTEDTEAVVQEIYSTLATFLPPPVPLVKQILDSLRKVMGMAVDLSIEMRTQRAEYMMLPPLQPEYDTNGELVQKVYFNASVMNERSGTTSSNEEVEAQQAVVRMVLFPLVVKRGGDAGIADEQIVVCPAQVLTAKPAKDKKVVRVMSADGGRSAVSFGASDVDMGNMI